MSRHSLNRTDRPFATYAERVEAGFALTRSEKLDTSSQLPFGYCCLALKPAKEPMATPYGHIFDREFILEHLVTQKKELLEKRADYEAQEKKKALQRKQDDDEETAKKLQEFDNQEKGAGALKEVSLTTSRTEFADKDKRKERDHNFWVCCDAPEAKPTDLQKESTTTKCPISGKKLRMKDLIPIDFEIADQKLLDTGGGRGMYCCALTKKPITHQKVVLIKPSGQVILESCVKDCVLPSMTCPVTSKKLQKSDIVPLVAGFTGFSAHNEVVATVFKQMRSGAQEAADRTGSLGCKGTVLAR